MKITEADKRYIQQVSKESGMSEERVIAVIIQNASAWAGFLSTQPDVKKHTIYSSLKEIPNIDEALLEDMFKILKYL